MIEKIEFFMDSTNEVNRLHVIMWRPTDRIKAILQISHGMAEYVDRYDRFATYMAGEGILVVGNDHLGHGESVSDAKELGYFATDRGSAAVVDDLHDVNIYVRAQYPDVPCFMLGHSMGSFMSRRYAMTYGDSLSGIIYMGTGAQPAAALKAGILVNKLIIKLKGERYRSRLLRMLSFGGYVSKIKKPRTTYDWLTRDEAVVDAYRADPLCGFAFTCNGYGVLFDVIDFIQKKKNIKKLPKALPMFFVSGTDDPVGHYSKDVVEIAKGYKACGVTDVDIKLYGGDRHELLNELDYEDVQADILGFVNDVIYKKSGRKI